MVPVDRRQRGQVLSLGEMIVVLGILSLLLLVGSGTSGGQRPGAISGATQTFAAMLDHTRELAASTGNGASLEVGPIGGNSFSLQVYAGRPNSSGLASNPSASENLNVGLSSNVGGGTHGIGGGCQSNCYIGIYVNSNGGASWSSWQTTPMATEPPCSQASPLLLTFSDNAQSAQSAVYCDDARAVSQ